MDRSDRNLVRGNVIRATAEAIDIKTGAIVERSLSAAGLIDMYVVRDGQKIVKNSIAERVSTSEFLTEFRYP